MFSYGATGVAHADPAHLPGEHYDPWLAVIRCRHGEIYPHGGALLGVEVEGHKRAVLRKPGCSPCPVPASTSTETTA